MKAKVLELKEDEKLVQFMNSVMKRQMLQIGYKDIGILSKYFDVNTPCTVQNSDLQVYRGFYTSIEMYKNNNLLMLVDVSTRVLQSRSCL